MQRLWAQPLRRQLFVAIALLLIPIVTAVVWFGIVTLRERGADLRRHTRTIALTTAAWVNRDLSTIDRAAVALSAAEVIQRFDTVQLTDLLRRTVAVRPALLDIILVRPDGSVVAHGASLAMAPQVGTDWVTRTVEAGARVVVPVLGGGAQSQSVVIGYPVRDKAGRTIGALGYVISLRILQTALAALPLPAGSVISVTDQESRILLRTLGAAQHVGFVIHPGQRSLEGHGGVFERTGPDGIHRMYADVIADDGPWLVSVGIPTAIAWQRARTLWARGFGILLAGLVGWLAVVIVLSRRLGDNVNHLNAEARRIAAGDFSPIVPRPMLSRELDELQDAFRAMLRQFNATRAALDAQMAEERRMREAVESLQGQVIRQERLAAVGQLVSGVAHEINNPLQSILGFAELLQMQPELPGDVKDDLRLIQQESARACAIIRNLALFARQQPGEATPVRLFDIIASVVELRQRRLQSENIELVIDDASRLCVLAPYSELQQVLLNFVINAEHAVVDSGRMPGRITIRTFDRGDRTILEVEDTGPGLAPENEAKLFQPFFTTKPVGQGTGLGLSISYGIVDSLGGRIGHRAAAAGGAVFYFDLPSIPCE